MEISSIEQIKKELGIDTDNLDDLRKRLQKMQAELYPKGNSGNFASIEEKDRYVKIDAAIELIDSFKQTQNQLVPISMVTDLMKMVKESNLATNEGNLELILSQQIGKSISKIKSGYSLPKISIASITGILTILWLIPKQVQDHPILSQLINVESPVFTVLWLMVLCLAAVFWSIMYKNEKEKKEFNLQLSLESFQNNLFAKFVENSAWVYHSSGDREFTKQHFLDYLTSYRSGHLEKLKIDIVLAESLANVILDRAVRKGVIKKDTKISLQDSYIILSR